MYMYCRLRLGLKLGNISHIWAEIMLANVIGAVGSLLFQNVVPQCGDRMCQHFGRGVNEVCSWEVVVEHANHLQQCVGRGEVANVHRTLQDNMSLNHQPIHTVCTRTCTYMYTTNQHVQYDYVHVYMYMYMYIHVHVH